MAPQDKRFQQYFLQHLSAEDASSCHCTSPGIHYFTDVQANEWRKMSNIINPAQGSKEIRIIERNFNKIFKSDDSERVVVDLGCGDGRKGLDLVKLLLGKSYSLKGYVAIDINEAAAEAARDLVIDDSELAPNECLAIQAGIEQSPNTIREQTVIGSKDKDYLLLGNTFNNFRRNVITEVLSELITPRDLLIIGVELRTGDSISEQKKILSKYSELDTDFEFLLGDLLGLDRNEMRREVEYNESEQRVEMWLGFQRPSEFMRTAGLGHCNRILATISYKPLLSDILSDLDPLFDVTTFTNGNGTLGILVCRKRIAAE